MPDDEDHLTPEDLDDFAQAPAVGDPDASLLTPTQRTYLRGNEPDLAPSTERTRRRSIRSKIQKAWIDMAIAFEHLSPKDRAQLLFRRDGSTSVPQDHAGGDDLGPPELFWSTLLADDETEIPHVGTGGLRQVFGLGLLSLHDALVEESNWSDQEYEQLVETLVAGALRDAMARTGRTVTIDVDIDIDDTEHETPPAEIESLADLRHRFSHRELQPAEFWDFLGRDSWEDETQDASQ